MKNSISHPKISVITIVRNGEKTLEKAIASVISQDYPNLEYIMIDGGSTDNTIEIIKKYSSHITYWHSKPDKGPADAVNIGIEKATGDIICFINADDWYEPNTLTTIANIFLKNPDADLVTCACQIVKQEHGTNKHQAMLSLTQAKDLELTFNNICFGAVVPNCRFFRSDFFKKVGLFITHSGDGKTFLACDKDFFLRAIMIGVKNVFVHHMGYTHLAHPGSATFSHHIPAIKKLYREHMSIAERFLTLEALDLHHKKLLQFWYNEQSARLFLREFLTGDLQEALNVMREGVRKNKGAWLKALLTTLYHIITQKIGYRPPVTGTIAPER